MFYKLSFNRDYIEFDNPNHAHTIYAGKSNIGDIEYTGIKKGWFEYIVCNGKLIDNWPEVLYYYDSKKSDIESEYLMNIDTLPIVHKKVQRKFEEEGITGIQYLPIKLIDTVSHNVNENYMVMNILNLIEAYNMDKSNYTYLEEFNVYNFLPHDIYLDETVCAKHDIFRCNKDKMCIYVSEKIKNIIEQNQWIGFSFLAYKAN